MSSRSTIFIMSTVWAGLVMVGCAGEASSSRENGAGGLIPAVEAVQSRYGALPLTERLTGVVKARNQIEIYPEISATIVAVHVANGDLVKKGQPLVRLRDKELQERLKQARAGYQIAVAQARQAEARLKEMQAELKRTRTLADKGLASPTDLETIETQAVSAEADVELAEARVGQAEALVDEREELLSQTAIRAPVAGTIGDRNAEVGMFVNTSTRLFTLGQLDSVRVEVELTDVMLDYIETGQRAEIRAGGFPLGSVTAPLSRISPFLHPVTHSTTAEIDLANPGGRLKSGMFVSVDVHYGESEQSTLVPLSALYENPTTGGTGVYVSQVSIDDREPVGSANSEQHLPLTQPLPFEFVPVEVIAKGRMDAGIRGVKEGAWVVTIGQDLLSGESPRARVRPVKWEWVQKLQTMQREDLLEEVMQRQQSAKQDTSAIQSGNSTLE